MIRVVELFAGIGAPRKALLNLNINFETCFFSEINKNAEKAYRSIFNDYTSPNLGDITKITEQQIENYKDQVDLLVFGSPCQDFSQAGLNKGGLKGSSTRSSLLWEGLRIINILKPKIVLFENVKNIIRKHC